MKPVVLITSFILFVYGNLAAQTRLVEINGKYALAGKKGKAVTEPVYDTIISLYRQLPDKGLELVIMVGLRDGKIGRTKEFFQNDSVSVPDTIVREFIASGSTDLYTPEGSFLAGNVTDIKISSGTVPVKLLSYFRPEFNKRRETGLNSVPAQLDFFLFQKSGKWGAMDFKGKQIIPLILDPVEAIIMGGEMVIAGVNNQKLLLYNTRGNSIPYSHDPTSPDFLPPCLFSDFQIVKAMIESGADRNYRNESCDLSYNAIQTNNTELWKLLIDKNVTGTRTSAAMRQAVKLRNLEVIRKLHEWEIDVFEPDENGITAVHLAMPAEDVEILKVLLKPVSDMSKVSWSETAGSPICWLDGTESAAKTQILMEKKFQVNALNGSTLHCAAQKGDIKLIRVLLQAGADKSLKDKNGKSAHQIALENNFNEAAALLK